MRKSRKSKSSWKRHSNSGELFLIGIITFGLGLTLRDGDRQYFYRKLDEHFPGVKEQYINRYGNAYELPIPKERELYAMLQQECKAAGMEWRSDVIFDYMRWFEDRQTGEQLSLF